MADVSHELGALRFVVDSPLSSKVAMFNNAATKHKESQHLNPFSQTGGLPKPTFNKGEYGKPLAGSLTEMRGQKANIHVLKEMLELCQIIDSEGYDVKDEPGMKVIPFGELFNIYTYISDKVVGILLRARKHKLIEFEGEVLFQRRDDDVPVFLLKPIKEIRAILEQKQEEIRRSVSPAPQATTVMIEQQKRCSSLSPTPFKPKATKATDTPKKTEKRTTDSKTEIVKPIAQKAVQALPQVIIEPAATSDQASQEQTARDPTVAPQVPAVPQEPSAPQKTAPATATAQIPAAEEVATLTKSTEAPAELLAIKGQALTESTQNTPKTAEVILSSQAAPETIVTPPTPTAESSPAVALTPAINELNPAIVEEKTDINNNEEAPAIVETVEASSNTEAEPPAEAAAPTVPNVV